MVRARHPLAGQTVRVALKSKPHQLLVDGCEFRIEDWWQNVHGGSWMFAEGNPACLGYALRAGFSGQVPTDDEVVYGKVGSLGYLVHVSELGEVVTTQERDAEDAQAASSATAGEEAPS